MQEMISDAMEQLLGAVCSPADIRRIEDALATPDSAHRQAWSTLWDALLDSGFVDALVSENAGGSGLDLADVFPVAFMAGRYALPLPLIHTMMIRCVLSASAQPLPEGPITIAGAALTGIDGSLSCPRVPFGRVADWVLVMVEGSCHLLPVTGASVAVSSGGGQLDADMQWGPAWAVSDALSNRCEGGVPGDADRAAVSSCATHWHVVAACAHSALLAGAMQRVLEMTVAYANERSQFGKAISRFQAIQQQLSVMAEEVFAAKMAAQIGFSHAAALLQSAASAESQAAQAVAVAKARTSAAVPTVSSIAHGVHGAIGFTEEYELQISTRRLHEMRMAYGAESFWHRKLGSDLIREADRNTVDFIRF